MERNLRHRFMERRRGAVVGAVLATTISFGLAGSGNEASEGKQPSQASRIPSSEFLPITIYNESPPAISPKGSIEIDIISPIDVPPSLTPTPEPTKTPTPEPIQEIRPTRPKIKVPDLKPKIEIITISQWKRDSEISWYGPGFYGNRTACGLKLTKELKGVAHKTLPCGTLVSFRWKGKDITVPVVDRGPYVSGRQFDLTRGACKVLNHCFTGPIDYKIGK